MVARLMDTERMQAIEARAKPAEPGKAAAAVVLGAVYLLGCAVAWCVVGWQHTMGGLGWVRASFATGWDDVYTKRSPRGRAS